MNRDPILKTSRFATISTKKEIETVACRISDGWDSGCYILRYPLSILSKEVPFGGPRAAM